MKIIKSFRVDGITDFECPINATMITHYLGVDISSPIPEMSLDDIEKIARVKVALRKKDRNPICYVDGVGWVDSDSLVYYNILELNKFLLAWSNPAIFVFDFNGLFIKAVNIGYEVGTPLISHLINFQLPRLFSVPVNLSRTVARKTDKSVDSPANLNLGRVQNCFVHEPMRSPQKGILDEKERVIHVRESLTRENLLVYYQVTLPVEIVFGDDYKQVPALPSLILRVRNYENRRILSGSDYMWSGNCRLLHWRPTEHADLNVEVSIYGEKSPEGYQDVSAIIEQVVPLCNTELYSSPHDLFVYSQLTSGVNYVSSEASLAGAKFNMRLLNLVIGEVSY